MPPAPPPPAPLQPLPITVTISREILKAAKASLKAKPVSDEKEDEEHEHDLPARQALQSEENGDEHDVEDIVDQNKVEVKEILSEGHGKLDHLVLHVQQDHGVGGVIGIAVGQPGGAACSQEQDASSVTENINMEVQTSLEPVILKENIDTSDELSRAKVVKTNTGSATCSVLGLTSAKRARKVAGYSSLLSDSQATSKAGLSLDSQATSGDGLSLDSLAGLSPDSQGAIQECGMRLAGGSKDSGPELAGGSQGKQINPYKWFDIAIEDGTENGGGRVMVWNFLKLFAA